MIGLGICSHGFQLSGRDRGELGVLFSDDVISLEELLKENLKIKQKKASSFCNIPFFKFIKPIYNCKDLLGKPKIFVIQERFKKIKISKRLSFKSLLTQKTDQRILKSPSLFYTHQHVSSTQWPLPFSPQFASILHVFWLYSLSVCWSDAFVWNWPICVKLSLLCWADRLPGLKRSDPCVLNWRVCKT